MIKKNGSEGSRMVVLVLYKGYDDCLSTRYLVRREQN